jgi:hypothetical protein
LEKEGDVKRVLARNPPTPDRFRSMQSELRPFREWDKQYCDTFLYPVLFLEELSAEYDDRPDSEIASTERTEMRNQRGREFQEFLKYFAQFPVAFSWGSATGAVTNRDSYCICPSVWQDLPEVKTALAGYGLAAQRIVDGMDQSRAYLLRIEQGVPAARLVKAEEAARPWARGSVEP